MAVMDLNRHNFKDETLFLIEKNKTQTLRLQDVMYSLVIMYSEDLFMDMKGYIHGLSSARAVVKMTLYLFGTIFCTNKCTITPLENI